MAKPVISLSAAKEHLRVEHDLDDGQIAVFAEAAVDRALAEIGLSGMLERTHQSQTIAPQIRFPFPVTSVTAVEKRVSGAWVALEAEDYTLSGSMSERQVLTLADSHAAGECYRVTWEAGLSADPGQPPAWFRVACLFLLGHYYENRSSVVVGTSAVELPMGFLHLLRPHKRWFFA